MSNIPGKILKATSLFRPGQRGITDLETAIALVAFVLVSSVFAFAALSTGLFSSYKAKQTISAGLAGARGTSELKGSVIAKGSGSTGASGVVTAMEFQVSNSAAGESIDMTPRNTAIKYSDSSQRVNLNTYTGLTSTNMASFVDTDNLLDVGEVFEVVLSDMTTQLATDLGTNKEFTLEVIPPSEAVLYVGRRTPVSVESSNNLN